MKNLIIIFLILITVSCKKYEEGPSISFKSKSNRLTSVWVVQDVTLKDSSILKSYPYYIFGFYNEGLFEAHSLDTSFNYKGWWEFSHDKNFIQISNIKTGIIERWKIIKLTKDKFWYKIQTDDPEEKDWIYVKLNASN